MTAASDALTGATVHPSVLDLRPDDRAVLLTCAGGTSTGRS